MNKMRKLSKNDIASEWSEGEEDGYWVALNPKLKWAGDPKGAIHVIHTFTKREAHREQVMPCTCEDCNKS